MVVSQQLIESKFEEANKLNEDPTQSPLMSIEYEEASCGTHGRDRETLPVFVIRYFKRKTDQEIIDESADQLFEFGNNLLQKLDSSLHVVRQSEDLLSRINSLLSDSSIRMHKTRRDSLERHRQNLLFKLSSGEAVIMGEGGANDNNNL